MGKASEELGLSFRQMERIRKRYLKEGPIGLISKKRGKESNRKISNKLEEKVLDLLRARYRDFGPMLASETLEKGDKIKISAETLRKWMIRDGLWDSKKKKNEKKSIWGNVARGRLPS